ncbi:META domain-containing protein [Neisseria leonii]|uniref:META domain-containing protein n=1 Tax=Neisseria leonii TaxID=2995413 RepID=UPI00237A52EF|nr:META domain-containing protein [Neisseria sp. 3986]MDD9325792.1 META domain-containing protein [Neisseria sp. 3986]
MMKKIGYLSAVWLLAACTAVTPPVGADMPLDGQWRIRMLGQSAAPQGAVLAFDPQAERLAATAGCNRINTSYQALPPALRFGPAAATRMACPPETQSAETALLNILTRSDLHYRISGGRLILQQADGTVLLQAERLPSD